MRRVKSVRYNWVPDLSGVYCEIASCGNFDRFTVGEKGIVEGSYGSCSGCDAFQAEFDYFDEPQKQDGKFYKRGHFWDSEDECTEEEFNKAILAYDLKLANFGKPYLEQMYDKAHYERRLSQLDSENWFDEETKDYCQWAIDQLN